MDHIEKLFQRIPYKHKVQILETVDCLKDPNCRKTLLIKKNVVSDSFRVRSGRYRVVFKINEYDQAIVKYVRLRNEKTYRDI